MWPPSLYNMLREPFVIPCSAFHATPNSESLFPCIFFTHLCVAYLSETSTFQPPLLAHLFTLLTLKTVFRSFRYVLVDFIDSDFFRRAVALLISLVFLQSEISIQLRH